MKHLFVKTVVTTLMMGGVATSCINDLNISSIDPQSSSSYGDMELLAKVYSTLGTTGQRGPAGNGDISSDDIGHKTKRILWDDEKMVVGY